MKNRQQGMVLLVSLMLLLMLTIIAITAATQSNLQLRISSNSELQNVAFQAAESGLQQWTTAYFAANSSASFPAGWSKTAFGDNAQTSVTTISTGPCASFGIGRISMNCFDIQSVGEHCLEDGTCTARASHRQGGQRRELNQ